MGVGPNLEKVRLLYVLFLLYIASLSLSYRCTVWLSYMSIAGQ